MHLSFFEFLSEAEINFMVTLSLTVVMLVRDGESNVIVAVLGLVS
jgi:hypothetical protein